MPPIFHHVVLSHHLRDSFFLPVCHSSRIGGPAWCLVLQFCAQAHTPSDDSDADKYAAPRSHDDEPKEECDNSLSVLHEERAASFKVGSFSYRPHYHSKLADVTLLLPSPFTAVVPNERRLANERSPSVPPFNSLFTESSIALSPKVKRTA